jgi:hypothetical protein
LTRFVRGDGFARWEDMSEARRGQPYLKMIFVRQVAEIIPSGEPAPKTATMTVFFRRQSEDGEVVFVEEGHALGEDDMHGGVDVEAGYRALQALRKAVTSDGGLAAMTGEWGKMMVLNIKNAIVREFGLQGK